MNLGKKKTVFSTNNNYVVFILIYIFTEFSLRQKVLKFDSDNINVLFGARNIGCRQTNVD